MSESHRLKIVGEAESGSSSCGTSTDLHSIGENLDVSAKDYVGNAAIVTLGCSKNLVDSEVMLGVLHKRGFRIVNNVENAELVIVNTCGFLESAVQEGIDRVLELAELKQRGRLRQLIVAGCMVERYRGDLKKEFPEVDRFISTDELLSVGDESDTTTECLDDARRPYFVYDETMPRVLSSGSHSTYVKISEGCDRKCSFCIIPNIRGELRSRPQASIENEVKMLLAEGVKELNFIAQDLTAYGTDFEGNRGVKSALPELLSSLEQFYDPNDPYWLRLFYAYPIHTDERLMRLIQDAPYICNYLDMPLQHVSNSVLKSMRRPLGERGTRKLIDSMRKAAPEVSLRTTFIVGFPGETEDDIAQLEEFVKEGHFHHAGVFMYSQEKEADSFSLPNQVPEEVKLERRERVMLAQQQVVAKGLEKFIGTKQKVLIEGTHEDTDLLLVSRTEFQGPEEDGVTLINEIDEGLSEKFSSEDFTERARFAQVEITEVAAYDLVGTLVSL